ncbi:MAG: FCD domain-containing protein [Hyphomicrobium sp.]|jgi:DNA-binding FadR family transcriptional regulator|nr:FCD domain-containing protein [Hyphomicrobium sp.]MBX9861886.1 FCD domain-containing protein [Hyphomicrobium sp.]
MASGRGVVPPWEEASAAPAFVKDKIKAAAKALFDQIASGTVSYGSRLPSERDLAEELALTRDATRQVIDFLESYDVVRRRPNSGTFVAYRAKPAPKLGATRLTTDGLLDISAIVDAASPFEFTIVRSIVEPEMVRLAAMYMSASDLRNLSRLAQRLVEIVTEAAEFAELEREFLLTVSTGTHNPVLISMYSVVDAIRRQPEWLRIRAQTLTPSRLTDERNKLQSLYEALAARDVETAVEFMKLIVADENDVVVARG